MEEIKTVALKVRDDIAWEHYPSRNEVIQYAKALVAELQKDATPVAEVVSEGAFGMEVVSLVSADDYSIKPGTKLYTHPHPKAATVPDGWKLIAVNPAFDDLMYWMGRCEDKGHLENCSDLIEPWEQFDYRVIEAAPSLPAAQSEGEQRECGCGWSGPTSETVMCGSVGPLCPECRETTEASIPAPTTKDLLIGSEISSSLPAQSDKSKWALKQIADLDPKTGSIGTAVFMAREALAQSEREHND